MVERRLITFEGCDGTGKGEQVRLLGDKLARQGIGRILTREPGGTNLGRELRPHITELSLPTRTELFLILADRAQHVFEVIRPALADGLVVISDRYTDSTLAYQGYGCGVSVERLRLLNAMSTTNLTPGLTIILDCPTKIALERAGHRSDPESMRENKFESKGATFQGFVRNGYLEIAKDYPERCRVVSTEKQSVDKVHDDIWDIVNYHLRTTRVIG